MQTVEPNILRKYFYEYVVLSLVGCVVYLFFQVNNLQSYIRNDLSSQRTESVKAIYQNSLLLETIIKRDK